MSIFNNSSSNKLGILCLAILTIALSSCDGNDSAVTNNPSPGTNVVGAIISPQIINTSIGSRQNVQITYQTNIGSSAKDLNVALNNLPTNWSAPSTTGDLTNFKCNNITSDSGCILNLVYVPTKIESQGSFTLPFSYTNNTGKNIITSAHIVYSSESGNQVNYTVNPTSLIHPAIGTPQPVTITFNTTESQALATDLKITNLATLPKSWKINNGDSFTCKNINSFANNCVLSLTYTPTKAESGSLNLTYSYINNNLLTKQESIVLHYNVSSGNTVVATYPQSIALAFGESRELGISFTSSDSENITDLDLDLTTLSTKFPGWSSKESFYKCTNMQSICPKLSLVYAPKSTTTPNQGYLNLAYNYVDKGNTPKTGNINIWYKSSAESSPDSVIVVSNPDGRITTTLNTMVPVELSFNSTAKVTNLQINSGLENLSSLNPSWSTTTPKFNCPQISLNNHECNLQLYYNPTKLTDYGSIVLNYSYINSNDQLINATYIVDYQPQTHNNAIIKLSANSIKGIINNPSTITYSFITNDGLLATNLSANITADDSTNPDITGTSLTCPVVNNSSGICTNTLTYTPKKAVANGKLTINYTYTNGSGQIESSKDVIDYSSSSSNQVKVIATSIDKNPINDTFPLEATIGESSSVLLNITTYDGSKATKFNLDSSKLLSHSWSIESNKSTCDIIESNKQCNIIINYTPQIVESNTISINYSYIDNNGKTQFSNITVPYRSYTRAWYKIASLQLSGSSFDLTNNSHTYLSNPLFIGNESLIFLINQSTFKLQGSNLKMTDTYPGSLGIDYKGNSLVNDHKDNIYRAISTEDGSTVQQFDGESWQCIGLTSGKCNNTEFKYGTSPFLAVDSNNQLYFTATGTGVLNYNFNLNTWLDVGNNTPIFDEGGSGVSSLAIDYNDNIYAGYSYISFSPFNLYKYNGSFWQKLIIPNITLAIPTPDNAILAYGGNFIFDHNNNLYLIAVLRDSKKIVALKYNNTSWSTLGTNSEALLNPVVTTSSGSAVPRIIIDNQDNIYMVINNTYLTVYKYNRITDTWDTVGQRSFNTVDEGSNDNKRANIIANIAINPDQTKLYVTSLSNYGDGMLVNVYRYNLN